MPRSHPLLVQLARVWRLSGRWLPNGWLDALRQLALFAGAYYVYRIVRGFVDGQADLAFEHARDIVDFERTLGLFFEPGLQAWALDHGLDPHRRELDVRELALPGHDDVPDLALRRAQPRLLLRAQHVHGRDGARARRLRRSSRPRRRASCPSGASPTPSPTFVGEAADKSADVLYNPYAAMPSMHVAFALMIAVPAMFLVRNRVLKVLWALYPLVVTFVVVVDRQPLLDRRRSGRARRRGVRASPHREAFARARPEAWAWRTAASRSRRDARRARVGPHAAPAAAGRSRRRRRPARARAQPPDRVAPDAERDLADRASC